MRSRVLCVGGSGFLGSNIAHGLEASGRYENTSADIWDAKLRLRFENEPFNFVYNDITKPECHHELEELVRTHDVVFNLASQVFPKLYLDHPLSVVELNLFHGRKVIDACVRHGVRLIHFSTSEVYGKSPSEAPLFQEDNSDCVLGPIQNQRWIYSCVKQLLDRIIFAYGVEKKLDFTIVRPFNVVGPLTDHLMEHADDGCPRVFAQFMSALLNGDPLRLVDGGKSLRCFTHVDDLVDALIFILDRPGQCKREIINIGNPRNEISIRDLALRMRDIFCREYQDRGAPLSELVDVSAEEFYGEGYEDTSRRLPDVSKLRKMGWEPSRDLDVLLDDTMAYMFECRTKLTNAALNAS